MLVVPALEFGDPVLLFVLMEADDPLVHARGRSPTGIDNAGQRPGSASSTVLPP